MADDLQSIIGCTHRQAVALLDAFDGNGNLAAEGDFFFLGSFCLA
jgi:hypothetical protein